MESIHSSAEIAVLIMLFVAGVGSIFCAIVVGLVSTLVRIAYHILSNLIRTKSSNSSIK